MEKTTQSSKVCSFCIFVDVCVEIADGCEDFYSVDEGWITAQEEKEMDEEKIEYLEAWRDYTRGF